MLNAHIQVDPTSEGPEIPRRLWGHFLENLGACLYRGGLLDPAGRPREGMVRLLEELDVPILRWPGGLFADGYHWRDGVGSSRPVRPNKYWGRYGPWLGPKDPNHFGTHEFLALCKRLGAEPYINVNMGSGTPREAADWVAYCNAGPDTAAGRERASNGAADPFGVRVWGIGNETYGFWSIGHSDAATYARRYREFHDAMTAEDPSITPVAVGTCDLWPDWNPVVLDAVGDRMAYLALHVYLPGNQPPYLFLRAPGNADIHYALSAAGAELARKIRFMAAQIERAGHAGSVRIALDEWNLWWWITQTYKSWWRQRDAVALAGMAGAMVENCEHVGLGNLAQAINVLGLIRSDERRVVATPLFFAMALVAATQRGRRLGARTTVPTFSTRKFGGIPATGALPLVVCHAAREGESVRLLVIQRRYEAPMPVHLDIPGVKIERVRLLAGPHPDARNDFAEPGRVRVTEVAPPKATGSWEMEMPAASLAAIEGRVTA